MAYGCCVNCKWYENGDLSLGISYGCGHESIYDENWTLKEEDYLIVEDSVGSDRCLVKDKYGD